MNARKMALGLATLLLGCAGRQSCAGERPNSETAPVLEGGFICDDYAMPSSLLSDDPRPTVSVRLGSSSPDQPVMSHVAPCGARPGCFVQADAQLGVRIVDVREPASPALSDPSPLAARVVALHASAERALVVTARADGRGHELVWYDIRGREAPRRLGARKAEGAVQGTHRLPGDGLTVALLVDLYPPGRCVGRSGTELRIAGHAADAALHVYPLDVASKVHGFGDLLLVDNGMNLGLGRAPGEAPVPHALTVLQVSAHGFVERAERMLTYGESVYEVARAKDDVRVVLGLLAHTEFGATPSFDVRVVNLVHPDRECSWAWHAPAARTREVDQPFPRIADVLIEPERATLLWHLGDDRSTAHLLTIAARDCTTTEQRATGSLLRASGDGQRLALLTGDVEGFGGQEFAREPAGLRPLGEPLALAHAGGPECAASSLRRVGARGDHELLTAVCSTLRAGALVTSSRLFLSGPDGLRAAGQLPEWPWWADELSRMLALSQDGLVFYDLSDLDAPHVRGRVQLFAR